MTVSDQIRYDPSSLERVLRLASLQNRSGPTYPNDTQNDTQKEGLSKMPLHTE